MIGVYFLYLRKELQYIGFSTNIEKRCKSHDVKYDFIGIICCEVSELRELERSMIAQFKPKLNLQNNIKHDCPCPFCKGTGRIEDPNRMQVDAVEVKREMAKKLRDKGYSIRQIQRALGYKSPRSVSYLLENDK